jgi:L-amino acid N-acyltransferase YncA
VTLYASAPTRGSSRSTTTSELPIRRARSADAPRIATIFNEGIADRLATFETLEHDPEDVAGWAERGDLILVAERDGEVVAWAKARPYDPLHEYYARVAEATLYVARDARGGGIGERLLNALAVEAEGDGLYKLIGKVFINNAPSVALVRRCGFREVGVHHRHGRLDGEWRDVLVVERLLGDAARADKGGPRAHG